MKEEQLTETVCTTLTKLERKKLEDKADSEFRNISQFVRILICKDLGLIKKK